MSNRVKELREKEGLTINDFAARLNVNYTTVSKWENSGNLPRTKAVRICNEFGCDVDWLLNSDGKKSGSSGGVGQRLQDIRGHYGWTLVKMSEILDVTADAVSKWERFGKIPFRRLKTIAEKCNVNYEWLATGKGKMFANEETSPKFGTPKDMAVMYGFDHGTAAAIERYVKLPEATRTAFAETLAYIMLDRPMSASSRENDALNKIRDIPR